MEETQTGKSGSKSRGNDFKLAKTPISNTLFVLSAEISLKPVRTYLLLLNIYLESVYFQSPRGFAVFCSCSTQTPNEIIKNSSLKNTNISQSWPVTSTISAVILADYQTKYYTADNAHNASACVTLIIFQYLIQTRQDSSHRVESC